MMNTRKVSLIAGSLVLLSCLVFVIQSPGQDAKPLAIQNFEGKHLCVTLKSKGLIHSIEKVQAHRIGDQWFLVGVGVDSGVVGKHYPGLPIWIAVSDISEVQVYPKLEDLKKSFNK